MAMVGRMGAPSSAGRGAMQMPPVSVERPQIFNQVEDFFTRIFKAFMVLYRYS